MQENHMMLLLLLGLLAPIQGWKLPEFRTFFFKDNNKMASSGMGDGEDPFGRAVLDIINLDFDHADKTKPQPDLNLDYLNFVEEFVPFQVDGVPDGVVLPLGHPKVCRRTNERKIAKRRRAKRQQQVPRERTGHERSNHTLLELHKPAYTTRDLNTTQKFTMELNCTLKPAHSTDSTLKIADEKGATKCFCECLKYLQTGYVMPLIAGITFSMVIITLIIVKRISMQVKNGVWKKYQLIEQC